MKKLLVTKINNCGNTYAYIYLDTEDVLLDIDIKDLSKKISHSVYGLNTDGLILLNKVKKNQYQMRIYNSDGSLALMCGNGLRGTGFYLKSRFSDVRDKIKILTDSGLRDCYFEKDKIISYVGKPKIINKIKKMNYMNYNLNYYMVDNGNKHSILLLDTSKFNLEMFYKFDIEDLYSFINSQVKPDNIEENNVSIVLENENQYYVRTRERGAGETLACGTASASIAFAINKDITKSITSFTMIHRGGVLKNNIDNNKVYQSGISNIIFQGYYYYES